MFAVISNYFLSAVVTGCTFSLVFGLVLDSNMTSSDDSFRSRARQGLRQIWNDRWENMTIVTFFVTVICECLGIWPIWLWAAPLFAFAYGVTRVNLATRPPDEHYQMRWRAVGISTLLGLVLEGLILGLS